MAPICFVLFGNSPFSISSPSTLHKMRLKYSCLGKERKLLESVTIPTNRLNKPKLESTFNCFSMPSFWSKNHQAAPYCILPATFPSLKLAAIAANISLSLGFKLYTMVLVSPLHWLNRPKNLLMLSAIFKSPSESNP